MRRWLRFPSPSTPHTFNVSRKRSCAPPTRESAIRKSCKAGVVGALDRSALAIGRAGDHRCQRNLRAACNLVELTSAGGLQAKTCDAVHHRPKKDRISLVYP